MTQTRKPKGTPSGGQFAGMAHGEPTATPLQRYTVVRDESSSANLTGAEPYPVAHSPNRDAYLLERRSDGRLFLQVGATADAPSAQAWADRYLADQDDTDVESDCFDPPGVRQDDVVAYTYAAEQYTPHGMVAELARRGKLSEQEIAEGDTPEEVLAAAAAARGIDTDDEYSFDSDDWPKVIFRDQITEGDTFVNENGDHLVYGA